MTEESSRAWKDQYMLRLPDGMRDRIKAAAEINGRSMNAEIVAALDEFFPEPLPSQSADPVVAMLLAEIAKIKAQGRPKPSSLRAQKLATYERMVREAMKQGHLPFGAPEEG